MRRLKRAVVGVALLLVSSVTPTQSQNNPIVTVDEGGTGSLQFPASALIPLPGVLQADPGPSGLTLALTYNLLGPPALVAGDVFLRERGDSTLLPVISDVIRFNPAGTGNAADASLVFYSDIADGSHALADTGFPTAFHTNTKTLDETTLGGNVGYFGYTPTPNEPGFIPGFAVTYNFISEHAVPEPASLLLVVIGGGILAVRRRWSRTSRT